MLDALILSYPNAVSYEVTIGLANLIGIVLVTTGLALLIRRDVFREIILRELEDIPLITMSAFFGLILSMAGLVFYPYYEGVGILINLVFWIIAIKSIIFIFLPKKMAALAKNFILKFRPLLIVAVFNIILGLFFLLQTFSSLFPSYSEIL